MILKLTPPRATSILVNPIVESLTLTDRQPVVQAALGVREADLLVFKNLTKPSGSPYINDDLNLANLSFLWRHAWLAKLLKFKAEEWKILLKIFNQDIAAFASPQAAWDFLDKTGHLKNSGFTVDELNWLLCADRSAKGAVKEADAANFLFELRKALQAVRSEYDASKYEFLTATPPTDEGPLAALLTTLLQKLNRDETAVNFFLATLRGDVTLEAAVPNLPAGFTFPATITGTPNNIPIRYEPVLRFSGAMTAAQRTTLLTDPSLGAVTGIPAYQLAIDELFKTPGRVTVTGLPAGFTFPATITGAPNNIPIRYEPVLRFTGVMTAAQRTTLLTDASLAAVTGIAAYQQAIEELFQQPRLTVKFYAPVFTAPLEVLPPTVDFKAQLPADLAAKIAYDAEQRLLRFTGIMSKEEHAALDALVPNVTPIDAAYHNAVNSLATQPQTIVPPDQRIWLTDNDLDTTLPANDTFSKRLANAISKALTYLSKTFAENTVVQRGSETLGVTERWCGKS